MGLSNLEFDAAVVATRTVATNGCKVEDELEVEDDMRDFTPGSVCFVDVDEEEE